MDDDDLISLFKANAWAEAKGALRSVADIAGQARDGSRHAGTYEKIDAAVEAFIKDFEGHGLNE
jgi:hypothetical protein